MPAKTASTAEKTTSESAKGARVGVVESDKRAKTRRVVVSFFAPHPKYGKFVRRRTILQVHDEKNESRAGDIVEVVQCRPVSKTKTWRLSKIVEKRSAQHQALASAREVQ
ncbi:MAG: 30S ribosomal protein S17 [Phycisphaerales bacterium]|nr:MAG: 30S ribosomal protein S17 [Phycisphaerales bacterium]